MLKCRMSVIRLFSFLLLFTFIVVDKCQGAIDRVRQVDELKDTIVSIEGFDPDNNKVTSGVGLFINDKGHLLTTYNTIDFVHHATARFSGNKTLQIVKILGFNTRFKLAVVQAQLPGQQGLTDENIDFKYIDLKTSGIAEVATDLTVYNLTRRNQLDGIIIGLRQYSDRCELGPSISITDVHEQLSNGQECDFFYQTSFEGVAGEMPVLDYEGNFIGITVLHNYDGSDKVSIIPTREIAKIKPFNAPLLISDRYGDFLAENIVARQNQNREKEIGQSWVKSFNGQCDLGRIWNGRMWLSKSTLKTAMEALDKDRNRDRRVITYPGGVQYQTGYYQYGGRLLTENEYTLVQPSPAQAVVYAKPVQVAGKAVDWVKRNKMTSSVNNRMGRYIPPQSIRSRSFGSRRNFRPPPNMGGMSRGRGVPQGGNSRTINSAQRKVVGVSSMKFEGTNKGSDYLFEIDGLGGKVVFDRQINCDVNSGKFASINVLWSGRYALVYDESRKYERVDLYTVKNGDRKVYIQAELHPDVMDMDDTMWITYCRGIEKDLQSGFVLPDGDCHKCGGDGWVTCPFCNGTGSVKLYGDMYISSQEDESGVVSFGSQQMIKNKTIKCPIGCCDGKLGCTNCILVGKPQYSNDFESKYKTRLRK